MTLAVKVALNPNTTKHLLTHCHTMSHFDALKVPIVPNYKGVCLKKMNPIHTILKYGDYYDFMDR